MRFRPRFSIRTLTVFVTLVCAYFGAWEATKRYGVPTHRRLLSGTPIRASSPAAFIIRYEIGVDLLGGPPSRAYHLWIFGYEKRLCESEDWSFPFK